MSVAFGAAAKRSRPAAWVNTTCCRAFHSWLLVMFEGVRGLSQLCPSLFLFLFRPSAEGDVAMELDCAVAGRLRVSRARLRRCGGGMASDSARSEDALRLEVQLRDLLLFAESATLLDALREADPRALDSLGRRRLSLA